MPSSPLQTLLIDAAQPAHLQALLGALLHRGDIAAVKALWDRRQRLVVADPACVHMMATHPAAAVRAHIAGCARAVTATDIHTAVTARKSVTVWHAAATNPTAGPDTLTLIATTGQARAALAAASHPACPAGPAADAAQRHLPDWTQRSLPGDPTGWAANPTLRHLVATLQPALLDEVWDATTATVAAQLPDLDATIREEVDALLTFRNQGQPWHSTPRAADRKLLRSLLRNVADSPAACATVALAIAASVGDGLGDDAGLMHVPAGAVIPLWDAGGPARRWVCGHARLTPLAATALADHAGADAVTAILTGERAIARTWQGLAQHPDPAVRAATIAATATVDDDARDEVCRTVRRALTPARAAAHHDDLVAAELHSPPTAAIPPLKPPTNRHDNGAAARAAAAALLDTLPDTDAAVRLLTIADQVGPQPLDRLHALTHVI